MFILRIWYPVNADTVCQKCYLPWAAVHLVIFASDEIIHLRMLKRLTVVGSMCAVVMLGALAGGHLRLLQADFKSK